MQLEHFYYFQNGIKEELLFVPTINIRAIKGYFAESFSIQIIESNDGSVLSTSSVTREIEDANIIFMRTWKKLEKKYGRDNLRFPKVETHFN